MQQNWTWNETTFIPKAFMNQIFISWHSCDIAMTQSNKTSGASGDFTDNNYIKLTLIKN